MAAKRLPISWLTFSFRFFFKQEFLNLIPSFSTKTFVVRVKKKETLSRALERSAHVVRKRRRRKKKINKEPCAAASTESKVSRFLFHLMLS
jgi:hypothetical protein